MKERPILFNTEMVQAIIAGEKTQTRRVCKKAVYPYGESGDELWVRETFQVYPPPDQDTVLYKADVINHVDTFKWKPSIFMPRKYSRIQLLVKHVHIQKIQEITTEDIWDEGIRVKLNEGSDPCAPEKWEEWTEKEKDAHLVHVARATYMSQCDDIDRLHKAWENLWNSINEKRGFGWDKNPDVWVIEFELKKEKDNDRDLV